MNPKRLALSVGLSIASIGAGYGIWGLILWRRGGDDANIGSGVALLLGSGLLIIGFGVVALCMLRNRPQRL